MNRIVIEQNTFKRMMDGVKHAASTEYSRPIMRYIKVVVTKTDVTMYALDGFRAAKIRVEKESDSEFTCFIKPIAIKSIKDERVLASIEYDDESGKTEVALKTESGEIRYCFNRPDGEYYDIEKLFVDAHAHDREIGVNAVYMAQAFNSIKKTSTDRNACTIIESKVSATQPFCLRAKDSIITNEQLILPIRIL